jgi:hypothetical protein
MRKNLGRRFTSDWQYHRKLRTRRPALGFDNATLARSAVCCFTQLAIEDSASVAAGTTSRRLANLSKVTAQAKNSGCLDASILTPAS